MSEARILSMLSLCMKAGRIQTGETMGEKLLRNGEAKLLIIAADASENTRKKFINKCFYYKTPVLVYGARETLSKSVGKQNRTVFIVTDPHFAETLRTLIDNAHSLNMEVAECPKSAYTN